MKSLTFLPVVQTWIQRFEEVIVFNAVRCKDFDLLIMLPVQAITVGRLSLGGLKTKLYYSYFFDGLGKYSRVVLLSVLSIESELTSNPRIDSHPSKI